MNSIHLFNRVLLRSLSYWTPTQESNTASADRLVSFCTEKESCILGLLGSSPGVLVLDFLFPPRPFGDIARSNRIVSTAGFVVSCSASENRPPRSGSLQPREWARRDSQTPTRARRYRPCGCTVGLGGCLGAHKRRYNNLRGARFVGV